MAGNNLRLQLEIAASGAGGTVAELLSVRRAIEATAAQSGGITQLANAMGRNYESARRFADGLGLAPEAATRGIRALRELNSVGASSEVRFATLTAQMGVTARQFQALDRAARQSGQGQAEGINLAGQGLAALAFRFNNVVGALQNLKAIATPVYEAIIASNEELNAQILSSQTNLASSVRIFKGDRELTDPTEKIQASAGKLRAAIKQIEIDTQSLVGVTSSQVNELFQITLTNAGALNQQSKQFPDAIAAATSLTKGWAASLKVVGIPLNQARQEINSIIKGQITQDSLLAKNLGITNQQVEAWRSQGKLVDELNKRLDVFVAGNAIAARSIEGISSNILDLSERIARNTGEPLLEPIIDVLAKIEVYLKSNETAITNYFKSFAEGGRSAIDKLKEFEPTFKLLEQTIAQLAPIAQSLFNLLIEGAVAVGKTIQTNLGIVLPVINKVLEGYKLILEAIQSRSINDAADALGEYQKQTLSLADASLKVSSELNKLNKIRAEGGTLTAEQLAREKQLKVSAEGQVSSIDNQIEALKELRTYTPEIAAARDNDIKILEALREKLDKASGGIKTQSKLLEDLGGTSELAAKKLENFNRQINSEGGGEKTAFEEALKGKVALIQSEVNAKRLSVEAARTELESVRDNTKAELEIRNSAKDAIDKLYDGRIAKVKELIETGKLQAGEGLGELARIRDDATLEASTRRKAGQQIVGIRKEQIAAETAAITAGQSQIEALQAAQRLGEAEGDRQLTILKGQELAKRLEQNKVASENATSDTERQQLLAERSKLNADLDKLAGDYQKRVNQRILADYDEQLTELEAFNAQKLVSEEDYLSAKTALQTQRADREIGQLNEQLAKLAATDVEGREAVTAQISKLQVQKIKVLEESYAAELVLIKDREAKALDLVTRSEQERSIALQKLVNSRSIRLEEADKERGRSNIAKQRAELQQARDFEAALARTAGATRSPEGERAYQQQVRDARSKTLQATLTILQAEGTEQERLRTLALKAIEDIAAARTRATDLQLSQIVKTKAEQDRQVKSAEANSAREVALIETASKALERQNALITAKTNLQKATFDARTSGEDLELTKINRSLEIRKQLDADATLSLKDGALSVRQRSILEEELTSLIGNSRVREIELLNRKGQIEQDQLETKRQAILFEQAAAKVSLTLEQQKNDLINQRAVIEARIAEFKAKQAILDAKSNVAQAEANNRKAIEAAELGVTQARNLAPGRERDRAIADAENKLSIVKTEAQTNAANVAQGVDVARQQAGLAAQNTEQTLIQQKSQQEVNKIQSQTLDVQQQAVLKQLELTESTQLYAKAMERAKLAAQGINVRAPENNLPGTEQQVNRLDPNADLTNYDQTKDPQPQVAAPRNLSPIEKYTQALDRAKRATQPDQPVINRIDPNTDFTLPILDRDQIRKNLGNFSGTNFDVGSRSVTVDNRELVAEIKNLQEIIRSRPPTPIVANFTAPDDDGMDKLFKLQRSALRID